MPLTAGKKLGPYEILSPLGAGGMGEVYRARDTNLNRDVALKVLPQAFASDAERMARFQREAQVLASLNHPNIASIYGLEASGGTRALVMELVEGQTLAERIAVGATLVPARGRPQESPLHLEEVLGIARQIAEALEGAHEKGIIHRDLKPANVKITPEGAVKVLDFGLAKALEVDESASDISNSPTMMTAATQAGVILGTAAYMSPEMARGKKVDKRADIWAFGCVLYEMLAGRQAFEGETVSDRLAAVLKMEPDWNALPLETPVQIRKLLRRCLEKNPKLRLRDIGDARMDIDEAISTPEAVTPSEANLETGTTFPMASPVRRTTAWVLLLAAIAIAAAAGVWWGSRRAAPAPQWSGELLAGPTIAFWPRVSPDGHLIAFQAILDNMTQVAVMDPGSGSWSVLTHSRSHGLIATLNWSQDGSKIYYDRFNPQPEGIYTVPTLGGEERQLLANAACPVPLPDGSLLVARIDPDRRTQLYRFWPETGKVQALGAWVDLNPSPAVRVFPGGKEAVFFGTAKIGASDATQHLYVLDIAAGSVRRLAPELPIVHAAQIFPLAVTADGQSVLIDLPAGDLHRIVAIARSGDAPVQTLLTLTSDPWSMDVGPDGSLYVDQVNRPLEILRLPVSGGTPEVLASTESYPYPAWFTQPVEVSDGRFVLPSLISGRPRLLLGTPGGNFSPLLETEEVTTTPIARVGSDKVALLVGATPARKVALASVKEGRIIRRFEETQGREITALAASSDGETLYYVSSGSVWSIPTAGGTPRKISAGDGVAVDPNGKDLIVNLDEQQYVRLMRVPLSGGPPQEIHVKSEIPLDPFPISADSVSKSGKALVGLAPLDSWFFGLGILDLATGELKEVRVNYLCDFDLMGWANDGRIIATATPMKAHIWRFKPVH